MAEDLLHPCEPADPAEELYRLAAEVRLLQARQTEQAEYMLGLTGRLYRLERQAPHPRFVTARG